MLYIRHYADLLEWLNQSDVGRQYLSLVAPALDQQETKFLVKEVWGDDFNVSFIAFDRKNFTKGYISLPSNNAKNCEMKLEVLPFSSLQRKEVTFEQFHGNSARPQHGEFKELVVKLYFEGSEPLELRTSMFTENRTQLEHVANHLMAI